MTGKKVKEPQTLAPKPPGKIGEAAYDASLHDAWQKMKKRADKVFRTPVAFLDLPCILHDLSAL